MINKATSRIDTFILAFGRLSAVSFYGALPIVTYDRINAAWDEKLSREPLGERREPDKDCATAGWAT